MKQDIILAGVGGQGILSIAFVIDNAALADGLQFKQAEVHGMAQRGGAVQSHLRLSSERIWSDLIPKGEADLILSVEPLEALRYFDYLRPDGIVVTSSTPYKNIPDYPDLDRLLGEVAKAGGSVIVDSEKLAKEAGTVEGPEHRHARRRLALPHPQGGEPADARRDALQAARPGRRRGQPQGLRPRPQGRQRRLTRGPR